MADPLVEEAKRKLAADRQRYTPGTPELYQLCPSSLTILEAEGLVERVEQAEAEKARAVYLAKNLLGMIPREVWRGQGGDDGQGHYEGDHYAERVKAELEALVAHQGSA